jgi:hypothetical protein
MKSLSILCICLLAMACNKDENNSGPNKKELLSTSSWIYQNGGVADANGNILIDFSTLNIIPACALDNTIVFVSDGSGIVNENTNSCNGTSTSAFSWNLTDNENTLNILGDAVFSISGAFKIRELTTTKLSLGKDTTVTGYGNVSMVFNLKHP